MKDLKEKTIRGSIARSFGLSARSLLRLASLMILARLLGPKDFGIVGMVTAFTGVLEMFRDFGLSAATVQRASVTKEQLSTLFWINIGFGLVLAVIMGVMAPSIATFYHQPRLFWVTIVLSTALIFNAAGVQHAALLQRQMRFTMLAVIDNVSVIAGSVVAIGGALAGFGYWSLVDMTVVLALTATAGFWLAARWMPGRPHRRCGIRSMMHFGGTLTLTGLIAYAANNLDKILLGRYWGVDAVGLYGRAYQLINIPSSNLNATAGEVAFSALSRLQDDPECRKRYFLKGFSLILGLTMPLTVACAVFAHDVVSVLLGQKWENAAPIFGWLAPTILVLAIANPLCWLLTASGKVNRLMMMSIVFSPITIAGYVVGLPYGPTGVACACSIAKVLWVIPIMAWAVHGSEISFGEVVETVFPPLVASIVSGGVAFGVATTFADAWPPLPRLIFECAFLLATFFGLMMCVAKQRLLYADVLRGLAGAAFSAKTKLQLPA
jgi:O-antigen/teichoic acid export membrane protein